MFRGRATAYCCFLFLLTLFVSLLVAFKIRVLLLMVAALCFVFALGFKLSGKYGKIAGKFFLSVLVVTVTLAFSVSLYFLSESSVSYAGKVNIPVEAEILEIYDCSYFRIMELEVRVVDGERLFIKFKAVFETYDDGFVKGDIIQFNADFSEIKNEGTFSNKGYYKAKGIFIKEEQHIYEDEENSEETYSEILKVGKKEHRIYESFKKLRQNVKKLFYLNIKDKDTPRNWANSLKPTEEAAVIYGIFVGMTNDITPETKNDFNRAGISHILSVSGLHFSLLTGILLFFLRGINVHKSVSYILMIIFCLFFMAFTGFSSSVLRSGIMLILYYAAFLFGLTNDSLTSLFTAVTAICIFSPYSVLHMGLQLSFLATLGIILCSPLFEKLTDKIQSRNIFARILKSGVSSLCVTISAIIFTTPVIAFVSSQISLVSPLTNLVVSPVVGFIMFLSPLLIILSAVPFFPVSPLGLALDLAGKFLLAAARWFGGLKYSVVSSSTVLSNTFYIFAFFTLVLIITFFIVKPYVKKFKFIMPSLIFLGFVLQILSVAVPKVYMSDYIQISFFTYKTNQYVLIFADDMQEVSIIDISAASTTPVYDLFALIEKHGAVKIKNVIFTHYHAKQPKFIDTLLNRFDIENIYLPEPSDDYDTQVLKNLTEHYGGTLKIDVSDENKILQNGVPLEIETQRYTYGKKPRIAVKIYYGGKSYIYHSTGYKDELAGEMIDIEENDIVLYGNHQHRLKDFIYETETRGNFATVSPVYKFEAYISKESERGLFMLDDREFITFIIDERNNQNIKYIKGKING